MSYKAMYKSSIGLNYDQDNRYIDPSYLDSADPKERALRRTQEHVGLGGYNVLPRNLLRDHADTYTQFYHLETGRDVMTGEDGPEAGDKKWTTKPSVYNAKVQAEQGEEGAGPVTTVLNTPDVNSLFTSSRRRGASSAAGRPSALGASATSAKTLLGE